MLVPVIKPVADGLWPGSVLLSTPKTKNIDTSKISPDRLAGQAISLAAARGFLPEGFFTMPIQSDRRPVVHFAAFAFLIIILLLNGLFLKLATAQTGASGSAAPWQELDEKLRDPRFLLLRAGAFDPLESEPAAVRVGQTQLETTSLSARSARLAARQTPPAEPAYYIVQYPDRVLPAQADSLRARGYEIVGYVANNAYIVRAPRAEAGQLQSAQGRGEFRWVGAYGAGLKIEPALAQTADEIANGSNAAPNAEQTVAISLLTFRGA